MSEIRNIPPKLTRFEWNALLDHSLEKPVDYIIRLTGSTVQAINGSTGKIDYSGSNAATVIQSAINACSLGQGSIVLKGGTYTLPAGLYITGSNITLKGMGQSRPVLDLGAGANADMLTISGSNILIEYLQFNGENASQTVACDGIKILDGSDIKIENSIIQQASGSGIRLTGGNPQHVWVCFSQVNSNKGRGFLQEAGYDIRLISDYFLNNRIGVDFIIGEAEANGTVCDLNLNYGAAIEGNDVRWIGGMVTSAQNNGFYISGQRITISGTLISNNGRNITASNITRTGIRLDGASYVTIVGNNILDSQISPTQTYGVYESGGANYNSVISNNLSNNTIAGALQTGVNSRFRDNIGYVTENSGALNISSSSGSFAHGLASIPTKIILTPSGSAYMGQLTAYPSGSQGIWVVQTGSGTVNFYWEASV